MRCCVVVILLAACGRFNFDDSPPRDSAPNDAIQIRGSRAVSASSATTFATASATFVDVPGGRIDYTADAPDQTWVVVVSAAISSESGALIAVEVRFTVDGVERGYGGAQTIAPAHRESYMAFDFVRGGGSHAIQLQVRDASGTMSSVTGFRMVAFSLPSDAEVWFADDISRRDVFVGPFVQYLTLDVVPQAPGDYLILGGVSASEIPNASNVHVRLHDPAGTDWPSTGAYFNHREPWYAFWWGRTYHLDGPGTFALEARGDAQSSLEFTRLAAIRLDAFDAVESAVTLPTTLTSSTTPVVFTTLTTTTPPGPRDYVVLQHLGLEINTTTFEHGVIFRRDDVDLASYQMDTASAGNTAGSVFLVNSAVPQTYDNTYFVTDSSIDAYGHDSVIHSLRLKPLP